ncbi:LacI family DNA-binding transcriptional regulator [Clostridium sp. UBA6640]|uniref:LacI family DNA-binding transcriptional regulator n=1 Tax=Clostridium sp. UBA6640 TaxID=1946370 RepID=UPI0025C1A9F0|nr:LacI family DNA-binding transcriptional regulator [Clostridium sp. UBA6640]
MAASIKDVAKEAGVSIATVSRVLNGINVVNEDTKRKVLDAIDKLGYRPNILARSLKTHRSSTIGIIIPDIANSLFPEVVRGAEDVANIYNYNIMLCNTDLDLEREKESFRMLKEKMVDGVVYIGNALVDEVAELIDELELPIVSVGTGDKKGKYPSVTIDNYKAAYDATNYLIDKGNKKVAFIGFFPSMYGGNYEKLFKGYKSAVEEKLEFDESLVYFSSLNAQEGYKGINTILENNEVDAVFCGSDEVAVGVINALREKNISVPNDVDVMGFSDTDLASMYYPTLTTISQPLYDMGSMSMRLLIKIINKEEIDKKYFVLPYEIIERSSCK